MQVNIIDKYIIQRFLAAFFFMLGAVLVIVLVVDLVEKMDMILEKKPPMKDLIFDYYVNLLMFFGSLLSPICVFLAVIFFTSQMAQRTELVAILSTGTSFYRILVPYLLVGIFLSGISFYLKGFQVPNATDTRMGFEYKYFKPRNLSKDRDIHKRVAKDSYVYMSYFAKKELEGYGFTMERIQEGKVIGKVKAERAAWIDSTKTWRLKDGYIRWFVGEREKIQRFAKKDTTFLLAPDDIIIRELKAESLNNFALSDYIKQEELRGSDILKDLYMERHRRFSDPIALIILTMIGYAMSSRKSRGGIALQIGLGVVLSVTYIALLLLASLFVSDTFPTWAAVWFPNVIFFPIAVALLINAPK
ncbi:MAG: LptF/LptG family permease [Bacteroidia bacterium]